MFYQTGEGLRSRLLHTEHGRKLRHLFQLGPRLPLVPALFELLLAASSDPARLSVRWFSGLPGKCSAQNQRICSGPLRISCMFTRRRTQSTSVFVEAGAGSGRAHLEGPASLVVLAHMLSPSFDLLGLFVIHSGDFVSGIP